MKKPILFLIFNRPEYTNKVFEVIKLYKPDKLNLAADGPRKDIESDLHLCEETRSILKDVDWQCEIKTLYRDINLGCKIHISSLFIFFNF